ncbi:hypothetical protein JCM1840_000418 [Sporobolomyces johnsonii]
MSTAAEQARLKGNQAFKDNNLPLALAHYSTAIQRDPSLSTAFLNRALVHLKLLNSNEALHDASTALDLDGGVNPKALFRRALANKQLGNLDAARRGPSLSPPRLDSLTDLHSDFELAKQQGAGDAVDRELADLLNLIQRDASSQLAKVRPPLDIVPSFAETPLPQPPQPSPSPSADRLRAALSPKPPPTPPTPVAPPTEVDGFLRAVSTRRITPTTTPIPATTAATPAPPAPTAPSPSSFAAKKEARSARQSRSPLLPSSAPSPPPSAPSASSAPSAPSPSQSPLSPPASLPKPAPPAHPPAAHTATSLEQHLLLTPPHDPTRLALLRALDPDPRALAAFMGDSLTPDLLSSILSELAPLFPSPSPSERDQEPQDAEWVVPLLRGLSRCRRFDSTVLFLDEHEKDVVRRVLEGAERELGRVRNAWGLV